jgi:membrane protein DedA with SNARE-associated domain
MIPDGGAGSRPVWMNDGGCEYDISERYFESSMENLFLSHIESLGLWLYPLFALGLFLEGEVVLFVAAYLVYEGYLHPSALFLIAFTVVPLGDYMWYSIGQHIGQAQPRIKRFADRIVGLAALALDHRLVNQSATTLLVSKFTYGFHRPTLLRIGMLHVPRPQFVRADIIASWLWIMIVAVIGYASAAWLSKLKRYFKFAEVGLLIGILMYLFLSSVVSRLSSKNLEKV